MTQDALRHGLRDLQSGVSRHPRPLESPLDPELVPTPKDISGQPWLTGYGDQIEQGEDSHQEKKPR